MHMNSNDRSNLTTRTKGPDDDEKRSSNRRFKSGCPHQETHTHTQNGQVNSSIWDARTKMFDDGSLVRTTRGSP